MATLFSSIYTKFLADIDDYELNMVSDAELNNICFGYLEKARAFYFPQCKKDLDDVIIQTELEMTPVHPIEPPIMDDEESTEDTDKPVEDVEEEVEEKYKVDKIIGIFNEDLTNREQYILALGMKKAWLSSKRYSADLMSKDVGDRDYKAVQGYNYLKELGNLDKELEEEIRRYAIEYTYSVEELSKDW